MTLNESTPLASPTADLELRIPEVVDARPVWKRVARTSSLDARAPYACLPASPSR